MNDFLTPIIAANNDSWGFREEHDVKGADGLIHCAHCGERRQRLIPTPSANPDGGLKWSAPNFPVWIACSCIHWLEQEKIEAHRREQNERNRRDTFKGTGELAKATFAADDNPTSEPSRLCRGYVNSFTRDSDWLLLYGDCGRGKTFLAAAVANALINKGLTVMFGTVREFEMSLDFERRDETMKRIRGADLLVIDDLTAERKSVYMQETAFTIIDTRLKSGLPCVVTTNATPQDFQNKDRSAARIYSRLLERSTLIHVDGHDRRKRQAQRTQDEKRAALLAAANEGGE